MSTPYESLELRQVRERHERRARGRGWRVAAMAWMTMGMVAVIIHGGPLGWAIAAPSVIAAMVCLGKAER